MNIPLTVEQVLLAALAAFVITMVLTMLSRIFRFEITGGHQFDFPPGHLEMVVHRCKLLFPIESMRWGDKTFQRGMRVQVVTARHKTFEGQFIGVNRNNIMCVLASDHVVAQELHTVDEIRAMEENA